MIKIIVRSRSDSSAVKACVDRFYEGIVSEVVHVGGVRGEKFWDRVINEVRKQTNRYVIVLSGRRDFIKDYHLMLDSKPHVASVFIPRSDIRNSPLGELMKYIAIGKSKFRLSIGWSDKDRSYIVKVNEESVIDKDIINPAYDPFLIVGEGVKNLESIVGRSIKSNMLLLIRKLEGIHEVFVGNKLLAKLRFSDFGYKPKVIELSRNFDEISGIYISVEGTIKTNLDILKVYESISVSMIRNLASAADLVVVPWSGGKDSTTALILAVKAVGRRNVRAIYVDTGVDFKSNIDYVEKVSKLLGIDYIYVRAPVLEELSMGRSLPTHDNRWCTQLKRYAVRYVMEEFFKGMKIVNVIGDRDAESIGRSRRKFVEVEDKGLVNVYPIKLWGAIHVQLYLLANNIPLNKLYTHGFYRIGCYICPSLRDWELYLISRSNLINEIRDRNLFTKFLEYKGIGGELR